MNKDDIRIDDLETLQSEVKKFDPHIALTDGKDGLSFYQHFAKTFIDLVNPAGYLLLEIGGDNYKNNVKKIFSKANLQTTFFKDLQGNSRVVKVQL